MNQFVPATAVGPNSQQFGIPSTAPFQSKRIGGVVLMFSLVIFSFARSFDHQWVTIFGDACLALFVVSSGVILAVNLSRTSSAHVFLTRVFVAFALISLFYLISGFQTVKFNDRVTALYRGAQVLSVAVVTGAFFFLGSKFHGVHVVNGVLRFASKSTLIVSIMVILAVVGSLSMKDIGFSNPNTVGLWLAVLAICPLGIKGKTVLKWLPVVLAVLAIVVSGSRTALGSVVCGLGVYVFWRPIRGSKALFWGLWFAVFFAAGVFIYLLSGELEQVDLIHWNKISREISGKNLLSGRDQMWPVAMHLIGERPWFGWGGGTNVVSHVFTSVSEHNMYLKILIQIGFVGMGMVLAAISVIWWEFGKLESDDSDMFRMVRVGAAVFFTCVMCQNFEITLLQVNLGLSMPVWAIVGLVIGAASNHRNENRSMPIAMQHGIQTFPR